MRGPGATSYAPALREWLEAVDGCGGPGRLEAAAEAYLRWNADARRGDPKALQFWLRDLDFKATLPAEGAAHEIKAERPVFPDPAVRELAVARWGEDFAASWLDGSAWDAEARTITARSLMVFDRLSRDLRRELLAAHVELVRPDLQVAR